MIPPSKSSRWRPCYLAAASAAAQGSVCAAILRRSLAPKIKILLDELAERRGRAGGFQRSWSLGQPARRAISAPPAAHPPPPLGGILSGKIKINVASVRLTDNTVYPPPEGKPKLLRAQPRGLPPDTCTPGGATPPGVRERWFRRLPDVVCVGGALGIRAETQA